ncbi:epididymal sperm-binding protein 1-like isoform X2 [Polypterus senegalus]|uniref:epididymal sperm-binding protein 1-like isoform X2 n=1 Tax=Polypterus senegalus TaxID=55291 RepID=UPI0019642304|nr:epididymal sperm-binding protein 1-like isoform X2 [Polypterus senegalus]
MWILTLSVLLLNAFSKIEGIPTTGGNANGAPCVFPFIHQGKSYSYCITYNEDRRLPWCATTSNYDKDKQWGYCPKSGIKAVDGNAGPECVFPFVYKGKWCFTCTKEDSDKKWCAVTSNYDEDKKWAYCSDKGVPVVGGNSNGAACVFPFIYEGQSYSSCIKKNSDKLWCATTGNYDKDKQWSFCPGTSDPSCAFPFTYQNKMYMFCTTANWVAGRPWCSLNLNYEGKWKYCSTSGVQTFGGNADWPYCVFPFIYKGVTYNSCTKVDSEKEWCSITSNYDDEKLWGYCATECNKK